jgi:murein DD-endopeptidase MepM/ murein hydrolase activator NlpD
VVGAPGARASRSASARRGQRAQRERHRCSGRYLLAWSHHRSVRDRTHSIRACLRFHPGLDLRAPGGTAVVAPAPGSITYAGPAWGFLNMVTIRHPGGFTTVFGHVGLPAVALGDSVTGGQIIAYVAPGIAGRSTAPHLHFGLLDPGGAPTNPLPCLP